MLMVLCHTGQNGYNMAPVKEVLLSARTRFHDLLSTNLEQLTAKAVADDSLQQVSSWMCAMVLQSLRFLSTS